MAIKCGNCGGFFTNDELAKRKPPRYPWALSPGGQRVLTENQQRNLADSMPCPGCGQRTLVMT